MSREMRNAVIESVSLGYEDHGILTAYLFLNYGGSGQGFGGYALGSRAKIAGDERVPYLTIFVQRVLEVVGVDAWEKLPGKSVRVDAERGKVHRLGNFLAEKWFDPEAEFKALRGVSR